MFEKLLALQKDGTLKYLVNAGLMSGTVYFYIEVYMWIDARMKCNEDMNLTGAVKTCASQFKLSERTIWRVVKAMKPTDKTPSVK